MAHGGKREKAGRPPGTSNATKIKRAFQDYFSEDEVIELIKIAKEMAKKKPEIMKFVLEQTFGKAPQRVELTGKDGESLVVHLSKEIAEKHGIRSNEEKSSINNNNGANPSPSTSSEKQA